MAQSLILSVGADGRFAGMVVTELVRRGFRPGNGSQSRKCWEGPSERTSGGGHGRSARSEDPLRAIPGGNRDRFVDTSWN